MELNYGYFYRRRKVVSSFEWFLSNREHPQHTTNPFHVSANILLSVSLDRAWLWEENGSTHDDDDFVFEQKTADEDEEEKITQEENKVY